MAEEIATMTLDEFRAELQSQGVGHEDFAFVCPRCKCVQSARDLIAAGAGATFDEVEKYLGFSCMGRWTGASAPRSVPDGLPCNWTLGGLFGMYELVVVTPDGERHPRFMPGTPEQARAHAQRIQAEG